jgi:putative membrane protein
MQTSLSRVPPLLFLGYGVFFILLSFHPYERNIWFAENLTVLLIVGTLVALYARGIRFSDTAYILMSILIFLHTIGGHFTFERVPFDVFTDWFGFERNMYDRVAHFSVGFYAFAIAELLVMKRAVRSRVVLYLFPLLAIGSVAMAYEVIEWIFAITNNPEAGAAYLGSQGDVWDAQKDMLADTLGAVAALTLFWGRECMRKKKKGV